MRQTVNKKVIRILTVLLLTVLLLNISYIFASSVHNVSSGFNDTAFIFGDSASGMSGFAGAAVSLFGAVFLSGLGNGLRVESENLNSYGGVSRRISNNIIKDMDNIQKCRFTGISAKNLYYLRTKTSPERLIQFTFTSDGMK